MTSEAQARRPAGPSAPVGDDRRDQAGADTSGWISVVSATATPRHVLDQPPSLRRMIAENQAVHEVAQTTDILAESVM